MQRGADVGGRPRVAVEEHVLPGNLDIVEDHQRVDLVEVVGERVVRRWLAAGEAGAADVLHPRLAHLDDEPDRVIRELVVAPVGDGRFHERLVGIRRRGFVLGPAHHDAVLGLAHHMQQHVRVLILRPLGAVALGIGIGRDMERIGAHRIGDMVANVLREARIDLVEHVLAVEERPHLADGLVARPGSRSL